MQDFEPLAYILPAPATAEAVESHLTLHQMAQDFRLEQVYRQAFASHCRWYEATARQNQTDFRTMQREPDLLGWLRRDGSWGPASDHRSVR
jgi:hypothetical protein